MCSDAIIHIPPAQPEDMDYTKNAARFDGFADVYDGARPWVPEFVPEIIGQYLQKTLDTVVDLGCGTGLSTAVWKGRCREAVGVDPNAGMLQKAREKEGGGVTFRQGYSHETGLPAGFADVVVCSQSFHWMEPTSTLREVNRLLKPGGIFATVDCDWPPITRWEAEHSYEELFRKVNKVVSSHRELQESFCRYPKERHLQNIRESGYFRYAREILFSNRESGDAKRLVGLAMSQGGLQSVLKTVPDEIEAELNAFIRTVKETFGEKTFPIHFSYRMRIGIK